MAAVTIRPQGPEAETLREQEEEIMTIEPHLEAETGVDESQIASYLRSFGKMRSFIVGDLHNRREVALPVLG